MVITSPAASGVGFNSDNNKIDLDFDAADDESSSGDFSGSADDDSDFTSSRPSISASTLSSSSSMKMPKAEAHESAVEEGKRVAREAASSAANALAAARPE